ncbi:MAG: hypothetical protein CMJ18_01775 [Phycisphaeraceae bacterium]|nr:hypothetical protein [Phycisphaeraceae bacterium]
MLKSHLLSIAACGLLVSGLVAVAPAQAEHGGHKARQHVRAGHHDHRGHGHRRHHRRYKHRGHDKGSVRIHIGGYRGYHGYRPGRYVTYTERVCVAQGHYRKTWVAPVYETRYDECGEPYRYEVRAGYYEKVWVPARHERRVVKKWVPHHRHHGHHGDYSVAARWRF